MDGLGGVWIESAEWVGYLIGEWGMCGGWAQELAGDRTARQLRVSQLGWAGARTAGQVGWRASGRQTEPARGL